MQRSDIVLAALAASGGATHTPVQVQKLFFMIDRRISGWIGGPFFDFQPKDYGPFDKEVYSQIEALSWAGDAAIEDGRMKTYRLTTQGQKKGEQLLASLDPTASNFIRELSSWVRGLSFADLVSAVYKEYPEMKANSIFREF